MNKINTQNYTCSECKQEFKKGRSDTDCIDEFYSFYATYDIKDAKTVCQKCYEIALRVIQQKKEHDRWYSFTMGE